jgi:hypothetical protein
VGLAVDTSASELAGEAAQAPQTAQTVGLAGGIALFGGLAGMRFHRRVDKAGLDPTPLADHPTDHRRVPQGGPRPARHQSASGTP